MVSSPDEAIARLQKIGSFPPAPEGIQGRFIHSLVEIRSLSIERLWALHKARKLMYALLRCLDQDGTKTGYPKLFAEQSIQLNCFIVGILFERLTRVFLRQMPAIFTCQALDCVENMTILVREACAELRPDIFHRTVALFG